MTARQNVSLVGVDVGTTSVKAVLLVPGTGIRHVARRPTITHRSARGLAYHEPGEVTGGVESAIAECVAAAAADGPPAGIGIASMAEAGVPLDRRGRPIGEIVAWFDTRAADQAAWLEERIGAAALFAVSGLKPDPKYTLPKLLWLRSRRPAAFAGLRRWAGVAELAALRLTGALATNASLACRTLAFDVAARRWDPDLLGLAGLVAEQMPEVVPLGRATGGLTAAAAARLGLPSGTPVAIAGHDHLAAALGCGLIRPGQALDSMGSAEVALVVTRRPVLAEAIRLGGFSTGCHAVDGAAYVHGGLGASGALVEWFVDTLLGPSAAGVTADPPEGEAGRRYEAFLRLLEVAGSGPGEVMVQPYLRGRSAPAPDRSASLRIAGLRDGHGLPDLALGTVEGAAYQMRWMFEELERLTSIRLPRLRLTGGGTRNPRWLAVKAALGPWPIELARGDEAAARGAAMAAGIAAGVFGSVAEATAEAAPAVRVQAPSPARARYDRAYRDRWLPWVRGGAAGD